MRVKIHYRKGEKNAKFRQIVENVADALEKLSSKGRIQQRLLVELVGRTNRLSGAWQDGDKLRGLLGEKYGHRFDLYNWETKTAIEIEESEVKYVWKDFIKLSIGARRKRVANGILICPIGYGGRNMEKAVKIYANAIIISNFMADLIWVKNLAIIGYER